jgi:integrase
MTNKSFKSYQIYTGVSVYKNEKNSQNYYVRIWVPSKKKYKVFSTGTTSLIESKKIGLELFKKLTLSGDLDSTPENKTFKYWCLQYLDYKKNQKETKHVNYKIDEGRLLSKGTGLCSVFGSVNIEEINNSHLQRFFEYRKTNSTLSNNTKNKYLSILKSVLRFSFSQNGLSRVPDFLKYDMKKRDNPRPSFHFEEPNNEYSKLLKSIKDSIKNKETVRYHPITQELYDLVMFLVHGYLRPTVSEIFSIKYKDVNVRKDPLCLEIRVLKGKTGFRIVNSTEWLVDIFEKMKSRNPDHKPDDFIFMSDYDNREYVKNVFQRQFRHILETSNLQFDDYDQKRSLYSLRHLSIQMRLVKSGGKINLLWFSQNCGTSIEMIQRFYSSYLPNNKEVIQNLQSFSD